MVGFVPDSGCKQAIEATGATLEDVAHSRIFIKNWDPSMFEALGAGAAAAAADGAVLPPASVTLIGVASLFTPDMLVEIEAVAIFG